LALFRREVRKSILELPHSFIQNDLLFRARSWIYVFPNHRVGLVVFTLGTAPLRPVDIHRKIMSDTENPRPKVVVLFLLKPMANKAKECILDHVFGLIRTHTQAAKIRS
jgi:hypothetical protein